MPWSVVHEASRMWLTMSKQHDNISVRWEPTLSIYNANHIPEMISWWINLSMEVLELPLHDSIYNKDMDDVNIIINNVMWPEYMTPNLLPNKDVEIKKIERFVEKVYHLHIDVENKKSKHMLKRLDDISKQAINHIKPNTDPSLLNTFIHFSYDLDQRRKNNLTKQLPKLWEQIKSYGEYSSLV